MASQSTSQLLGDKEDELDNPYKVYQRLLQIVTNESISPEVLPYEGSILDSITDQTSHMTKNLNRLKDKLPSFCTEQHSLELERFAFVVNRYLKTRLEKIEKNAVQLVCLLRTDKEQALRILSPLELKYLDRYVCSIDTHLEKTVLKDLPANMSSFKLTDLEIDDEYDCHYVFVKALKNTCLSVDDAVTGIQVIDLKEGKQYFLPYSSVRIHLMRGDKDLLLL